MRQTRQSCSLGVQFFVGSSFMLYTLLLSYQVLLALEVGGGEEATTRERDSDRGPEGGRQGMLPGSSRSF